MIKFKSKTKYTWEGWESSGREAWVFNVEHPCELMGVHARLIDNQLNEGEKVEYCIYSPRVSSTSTPFGLKAEESSCGLCITNNRFIVSKNKHIKGIEPRLVSIKFEDILHLNIGKALLLGWFFINYNRNGQNDEIGILFSSTGKHHFEKALRSYKKYWSAFDPDELGLESFSPANFIYKIQNKIHAERLKTLMSSGEKCLSAFSCKYLWVRKEEKRLFLRQKQSQYFFSDATCLLTNKTLLLARDSLGGGIGSGIDVLIIPLEKIQIMNVLEHHLKTQVVHILKIYFKNGLREENLEIPLVADTRDIKFLVDILQGVLKTNY